MKKQTKRNMLIGFLLIVLLAGGIYEWYSAEREKKFLGGTLISNHNGLTMEVTAFIQTEDRFGLTIRGSANNGENIAEDIQWDGDNWEACGIEGGTDDNPSVFSYAIGSDAFRHYISTYKAIADNPYLIFRIVDLGNYNPRNDKWEADYSGPWRLCVPMEQTHPTTRMAMDQEFLMGGYRYKLKEIGLDVLGLTLWVEQVNPATKVIYDKLIPPIFHIDIVYTNGERVCLSLGGDSASYSYLEPMPQNLRLSYVMCLHPNASDYTNGGEMPLLDVANIKSIYVDGMNILERV